MPNPERLPYDPIGKTIDEFDEQLHEVRNGDKSPGALETLKKLYLELERLWVIKGQGKADKWRPVAPSVNTDMRDAAVILHNHGMIDEHVGK